MSDSLGESEIDSANQALRQLEAQLEEAAKRLAQSDLAGANLQSRLGQVMAPHGSSRERLIRAVAHARLLARQEGLGRTLGRGGRKIARKLGLDKGALAEAAPAEDIPVAKGPTNPDAAKLREFFGDVRRIQRKADEVDRRLAVAKDGNGPNYVHRPDPVAPTGQRVKLIALYEPSLVQSWSLVAKAAPQFEFHYQPHLPGPLGFYDTRVSAVQKAQADLAKEFGIHGFAIRCSSELDWELAYRFATNPDIEIPFCVMLGRSSRIEAPILEKLVGLIEHRRYLKIETRQVLLVEDVADLGDACDTVQQWRQWFANNGIGNPYLICGQGMEPCDPRSQGFDAAISFPGTGVYEDRAFLLHDSAKRGLAPFSPEYGGKVYSYPALVGRRPSGTSSVFYPTFDCVFPSRDDDPLSPGQGTTFAYSSPELYKRWLRSACSAAIEDPSKPEKLVFVDSWNSWERGAHLEPDQRYGFAYLKATAEGLEFASKFAGRGEEGQGIVEELIKTPDFERFLTLSEEFFGYKVPDKWREMATRGESAFRSKLDAIEDHIILVHSVGKVGSTSVYHALLKGPLAPISFHTHLIPNGLKVASEVVKQYAFPLDALFFIRLGDLVEEFLHRRGKDVRVSIVSGVRDPIARNVASFFDNLSELMPNVRARWETNDLGLDELHQVYLHIANESPGEWFQRQLEPIAGIDVYSRPFNVSEGYDVYEHGDTRTLVIRVEDLDRCGQTALTNFFGLEDISLARENKAEDKFYSSLLREFRRKPMPMEYLDTMYGGQFARHFYSPAEIDGFRTQWSGRR